MQFPHALSLWVCLIATGHRVLAAAQTRRLRPLLAYIIRKMFIFFIILLSMVVFDSAPRSGAFLPDNYSIVLHHRTCRKAAFSSTANSSRNCLENILATFSEEYDNFFSHIWTCIKCSFCWSILSIGYELLDVINRSIDWLIEFWGNLLILFLYLIRVIVLILLFIRFKLKYLFL